MRNRPGKRERIAAKRDAFQRGRASIIAANLASPKPERPVYGAPKGFRSSIANRDNLREKSHDIGFVGPRGFHTPKDTVSKREQAPGFLVPSRRTAQERAEALALAATVTGWGRETKKN